MADKSTFEIVLYTCPERRATLAATLRSLGQTDWRGELKTLVDDAPGPPSLDRMARNFVRALEVAAASSAPFVLVVEDDLRFNRHLQHNVEAWLTSFRPRDVGSLYRSSIGRAVGNQAILTSPDNWQRLHAATAQHQASEIQPFDLWLRQQVAERNFRVHAPSLVQHAAHRSTCGHVDHHARNFDDDWWQPS